MRFTHMYLQARTYPLRWLCPWSHSTDEETEAGKLCWGQRVIPPWRTVLALQTFTLRDLQIGSHWSMSLLKWLQTLVLCTGGPSSGERSLGSPKVTRPTCRKWASTEDVQAMGTGSKRWGCSSEMLSTVPEAVGMPRDQGHALGSHWRWGKG